ncbi:MAG: type II secretion system F family protein [Parcubacteria group bacterium]
MDKKTKNITASTKKPRKQIYIGGVSQKSVLFFTKNLSILLKAGSTLSESLEVMREQTKGKLQQILFEINEKVQRGLNFSDALAGYPKVFSIIYVNMIKIGEQSGTLEMNLEQLAKQLEAQYKLRKKIVGAMVYPSIIFSGTILIGGGVVLFVLPKITRLFKNFRVELPLSTRMLIAVSDFFQNYGVFAFIIIIAAIVGLTLLLRGKFIKPYTHWLILKMPIINNIARHYNLSMFYRSLNTLLKSGVTIDEGINICSETAGNEQYKIFLKDTYSKVKSGSSLCDIFKSKRLLFPLTDCQIISVGEESGTLADSLAYCAALHDDALDDITKNLSNILEPVLFVIIGLMVGVLALAVITPIYSITKIFEQ